MPSEQGPLHQVHEVQKLVRDALVKLDQVEYALKTLQERLESLEDRAIETDADESSSREGAG